MALTSLHPDGRYAVGPMESQVHSLPPDVLAQSATRVRMAALAVAGLWLIALIMANPLARMLEGQRLHNRAWPMPGNLIAAVGILAALLLAWYAPRAPQGGRILYHGLAFEVFTCALIAFVGQWAPAGETPGVSWICIIILIFPAIAPAPLTATLAAGLLAATMDPVFYLVAHLRMDLSALTPLGFIWEFIPPYICAVLAILPLRVIRGLGREVSEARQVGNYRLEKLIGKGGMGEVYRATHRLIARPAAVKLISPESLRASDPAVAERAVERFRREALAVAALRSQHTIALFDYGVTDGGSLFYVMELLDGMDLQDMVDRHGPLPPARVIHFLRHACDSLGEAHRLGLVHRDIKPSNLFACRLGMTVDVVKVLDFGLVTDVQPVSNLTMPEVRVGTPAFMAPESMDSGAHDVQADLYGLGSVAFFALTGRLVFEAASLAALMGQVMSKPAPAVSEVRKEGDPVPRGLEQLIASCLEKVPARRPATAEAMLRVLDRLAAEHPWTVAEARDWWETRLPETPREAAAVTSPAV